MGGEGGKERKILMGINMIGAAVILMSKELYVLYLGLEIYSFTTYILITPRGKGGENKISIQYLYLNSFSSALILIAIYV